MLRNDSLPEVWIPPASLLDLRDLMRTRLATRRQGSELKCRILAALRRYGVRRYEEGADLFAESRRPKLGRGDCTASAGMPYGDERRMGAVDAT